MSKSNINFHEDWLLRNDNNNIEIKKWCINKNSKGSTLYCLVCQNNFSYQFKGFQALIQHSNTDKHSYITIISFMFKSEIP